MHPQRSSVATFFPRVFQDFFVLLFSRQFSSFDDVMTAQMDSVLVESPMAKQEPLRSITGEIQGV